MIRFNIIGTGFLDFTDEGGISFKTENQFFRFSDISLGRSVEFSVPATDREHPKKSLRCMKCFSLSTPLKAILGIK